MKKVISIMLFLACAMHSQAQGTLTIGGNIPGQMQWRIYPPAASDPCKEIHGNTAVEFPAGTSVYPGPPLSGPGYSGEILAGPGAGLPESQLMSVAYFSFRTGPPGFMPTMTIVIPGVQPGSAVTVQVRAWENGGGQYSSWSAAACAGALRGASRCFNLMTETVPPSPLPLFGLESFNIHYWPPVFTSQPQSKTIVAGEAVTFTARISGCEATWFQWKKNGADISGATASAYCITNAGSGDAGTYSVMAANAHCSTASSDAVLAVVPVDHFTWGAIASAQSVSNLFAVTITARDTAGCVVSNFNGRANLSAFGGGETNSILNGAAHTGSEPTDGSYTDGYAFTPNTNILVTHVRHYYGTKVSIWTDAGTLVAAQDVSSTPGAWVETALAAPVSLAAGTSYRIGTTYPAATTCYYSTNLPATFACGVIGSGYWGFGDAFPAYSTGSSRLLADIRYIAGPRISVPISLAMSGDFTNGMWTGNLAVLQAAASVMLSAGDALGHTGASCPPFDCVVPSLVPVVMPPTLAGGTFSLGWQTIPGRTYRIDVKPDLNAAAWLPLRTNVASASTLSTTDTLSSASRFYRIVLLP